jgi:3-deoxy-manno-octulosonate cytidylyltransferase (CMP-KDO synthetase)
VDVRAAPGNAPEGRGAACGPRAIAIVPARLGSLRLPRKVLLDETGLPLVAHTARNVARCEAVERVVVATDSDEVRRALEPLGVEVTMTRADHASGTDRVFEALGKERGGYDVVLNVQADEPELHPPDLGRLVAAFADPEVEIATLCGPVADEREASSPAVVKVVRDRRGDALYFSRASLPYRPAADPARPDAAYAREGAGQGLERARRHVGVYAFRPAALERFCGLPHGELERLENLEQLRWLEAGRRMRVLESDHVPLGIDTRNDYDAFCERIRAAAAR